MCSLLSRVLLLYALCAAAWVVSTDLTAEESANAIITVISTSSEVVTLYGAGATLNTDKHLLDSQDEENMKKKVASTVKNRQLLGKEKEVVTIVVHDKIRGYLNWMQDWFVSAARNKCSTTCIVSEDKRDVSD
jgi:hypothetical protein